MLGRWIVHTFSPSSLSGLALWLNAETIEQADSTNIATWADSSANGKNATQATAGRQPTHRTGIVNGRSVVRFDGSADTLVNTAFSLGTSCAIYCVASTVSSSGGFQRLIANENNFFVGRNATIPPQFASFFGDGSGWGTTPGHGQKAELGLDTLYVMTTLNDAGAVTAYLNGDLVDTVASDPMTAFGDGYTVGASPSFNQFWDKDACEILIYNVAHTSAERALVESYLMRRWIAYPHFTRYSGNPIITISGTPGTGWESVDVANPDVFYDTPNSRWVMHYSGNRSVSGNDWNTGLAYSTNLLTWTKEAANPVFTWSGADEANIAANGSIVLKGSTYYLYYHAGFPGKIKVATSSNLLSWTRQGVCVDVGSAGQWDETATFDPTARLMPDGVTIEIFYAGKNASGARRIGRATSTDGLAFAKTGALLANAGMSSREDNFGEPHPLGDTGTSYELWVDRAITDGYRSISRFSTSNSGSTWTFKGNFNPSGSGWDAVNVFDNAKVVYNGTLYMFYAGAANPGNAANTGAQIGVATMAYP